MPSFRVSRDTLSVLEDRSGSGNVLADDTLATRVTHIKTSSGLLTPVPAEGITLEGLYGYLTIMPDGSYTYLATTTAAERLRKDATASDTFTYTASGSGGVSGSTTLKITVIGVNDAPVLTSTSAMLKTLTEDQTNNSGQTVSSFLASSDVDSSALRGIAITGLNSGNGQWQYSINGGTSWINVGPVSDGSALLLRSSDYIRFVPDGSSPTTAELTYRAWDQTSGSAGARVNTSINGEETAFSTATATAGMTVTAVNDAPIALASSASGVEDGPAIIGQVEATDVDGSVVSFALVANSAVGGTVSLDPGTGEYSFLPFANFSGTASFGFTASDGSLNSSPATVTIAIVGVNDAPIAIDDQDSTFVETPILLDLLANDLDIDGDTLSITAVGNAAHGTVAIEDGQVRYSPAAGFVGADAFTYTISDGAGGTSQAISSISVAAAGEQPDVVSITFRQGANGYSSAVDTMLKQSRASTSFGDAIVARPVVESGKNVQALLKFDQLFGSGPGQIPVGATIITAALQLQVTGDSPSGGTINRMLSSWSGTSTWNSLGSGVQVDGVEATSTGAISVGAIGLGSRTFNVTDSVAAWNAAAVPNASNQGWLFNPGSTDPWDFTTSQGAVEPLLSVTYIVGGPAPTSLPTVSIIAGAPSAENSGRSAFSLSLSQASSKSVTVYFSTVDHTAKAGSDYVHAVRSVTFAPGETSKAFDISLVNDGLGERLESFSVQIDMATNARIGSAVAFGRVTDDDALVAPLQPLSPAVAAVHALSNGSKYLDGGSGGYGIGDPSAIAYIPSIGLFVADSEHDESPYYSKTNLFVLGLDGSYVRNHSLSSFTVEPTGLAYNPANGFIYIADDDKQGVFWASPSNPSAMLGFFSTASLGLVDTEDLKFDPVTGNIHILDGLLKQIVELTPQGAFVNSVVLPAVMSDAEALAYDARHDVYFVASGASSTIWILDAEGNIEATLNTLGPYSPRPKIKGMELAPSSDPNDGNQLSLYVVDYGADQVNDGRMFEITLGSDWFF